MKHYICISLTKENHFEQTSDKTGIWHSGRHQLGCLCLLIRMCGFESESYLGFWVPVHAYLMLLADGSSLWAPGNHTEAYTELYDSWLPPGPGPKGKDIWKVSHQMEDLSLARSYFQMK